MLPRRNVLWGGVWFSHPLIRHDLLNTSTVTHRTYCTTVGSVQGCCRVGHICNTLVNECTVQVQQRCPNENFCCPAGDTCYRDANNSPRCSSNNLSASSNISILPTPTHQSSHSSNPSPTQTGTLATPVPTDGPQQSFCRLKPLTSRSQGRIHWWLSPAPKPGSGRRGRFR